MNRWAITLRFATGLEQIILVSGNELAQESGAVIVDGVKVSFPGIEIVRVRKEGSGV